MGEGDFLRAMSAGCFAPEDRLREMLDLPMIDLGFDSLDLEILRTVLERRLGGLISDEVWQGSKDLRDLMGRI